eukprot:13395658-Alexandrium_andersonii.AAC.1
MQLCMNEGAHAARNLQSTAGADHANTSDASEVKPWNCGTYKASLRPHGAVGTVRDGGALVEQLL